MFNQFIKSSCMYHEPVQCTGIIYVWYLVYLQAIRLVSVIKKNLFKVGVHTTLSNLTYHCRIDLNWVYKQKLFCFYMERLTKISSMHIWSCDMVVTNKVKNSIFHFLDKNSVQQLLII